MSDPNIKKNFAVGSGPVNRRLVVPEAAPDRPQSAVVRARLAAVQARQRLGASMADRLAGSNATRSGQAFGLSHVLVGIGGTASAVALMLGVILSSHVLVGVGVIGVMGVAAKVWFMAKTKRLKLDAPSFDVSQLVDAKDIDKLDVAMATLARDAPQHTLDQLSKLKSQIARCVALMSESGGAALTVDDDRLFIGQCIRRYLPDTIKSYLQIPQKDRTDLVIEDGKSASMLLTEQLDMLSQKLVAHENRLTQGSGDSLMRQQRFLAEKMR